MQTSNFDFSWLSTLKDLLSLYYTNRRFNITIFIIITSLKDLLSLYYTNRRFNITIFIIITSLLFISKNILKILLIIFLILYSNILFSEFNKKHLNFNPIYAFKNFNLPKLLIIKIISFPFILAFIVPFSYMYGISSVENIPVFACLTHLPLAYISNIINQLIVKIKSESLFIFKYKNRNRVFYRQYISINYNIYNYNLIYSINLYTLFIRMIFLFIWHIYTY